MKKKMGLREDLKLYKDGMEIAEGLEEIQKELITLCRDWKRHFQDQALAEIADFSGSKTASQELSKTEKKLAEIDRQLRKLKDDLRDQERALDKNYPGWR